MKPRVPADYFHIELIQSDLARRKSVNSRYSMRAYAAKIGCDPSALCRILQGKQEISLKLARKIIRRLPIDTDEKRRFLRSVVAQQSHVAARELAAILESEDLRIPVHNLPPEVYRQIADPAVMAILECHDLRVPTADLAGIAAHLELSIAEVASAIERLKKIGLLVPSMRGPGLVKAAAQFRADPASAPQAHANYYAKLLDKVAEASERTTTEPQIFNGLSLLIDPSRIAAARALIQTFASDLCELLEQGDRTVLYQLGLQLFPFGDGEPLGGPRVEKPLHTRFAI